MTAPKDTRDRDVSENVLRELAFRVIREAVRPGTRVLDIGCGFGDIGNYFAKAGAVVDGIEPDKARAASAREVLEQVWHSLLEDAPCEKKYDVVTILDVLEHLVSPVEGLEKAKTFLAPGGRLFLFVPNSAHWRFRLKILKGDWSYADWGLFDRTHLRFFDPATAATACAEAGLTENARWYTSPEENLVTRIGLKKAPSLFALHVLFELTPRAS